MLMMCPSRVLRLSQQILNNDLATTTMQRVPSRGFKQVGVHGDAVLTWWGCCHHAGGLTRAGCPLKLLLLTSKRFDVLGPLAM
jgi:hypothetical protein